MAQRYHENLIGNVHNNVEVRSLRHRHSNRIYRYGSRFAFQLSHLSSYLSCKSLFRVIFAAIFIIFLYHKTSHSIRRILSPDLFNVKTVTYKGYLMTTNNNLNGDHIAFIAFNISSSNHSYQLQPDCASDSNYFYCITVFLSNTVYRVSDIVTHNGLKWQDDSYHILNNATFHSSLLHYMLNHTGRIVNNQYVFGSVENNKWILARELKNLASQCPFPDDTLLYYMRLGKSDDEYPEDVYNSFLIEGDRTLGMPLADLIDHLIGFQKVTMSFVLHYGAWSSTDLVSHPLMSQRYRITNESIQRNYDYIVKQINMIKEVYPYMNISIHSSVDIDHDLCLYVNAKHVLAHGNGFPALIRDLRRLKATPRSQKEKSRSYISSLSFLRSFQFSPKSSRKRLHKKEFGSTGTNKRLLNIDLKRFNVSEGDEMAVALTSNNFNVSESPLESSSSGRLIVWYSDNDGLFSQFLQLKVKYLVGRYFNRTVVIPPWRTEHFDNDEVNLCEVFVLPAVFQCISRKTLKSLNDLVTMQSLMSLSPSFNYQCDKLPSINFKNRKGTITTVLPLPLFPLRFHEQFDSLFSEYKKRLNVDHFHNFTVVHWRRGDQADYRCQKHHDKSLNCGGAEQLLNVIRRHTSHDLIYIATNEDLKSREVIYLQQNGCKVFTDSRFTHLTKLEIFVLEILLMLEATTFLSFGVGEVHDVIDFERSKAGRSYCQRIDDKQNRYHNFFCK